MYKSLEKCYFSNPKEYNREFEKRKNDISSTLLNININGHDFFFVYCPEIVALINNIWILNSRICSLYEKLPGIAKNSISKENLIEELLATNDIEGVHSTRKEIVDVIESDEEDSVGNKRFEGLITKCLMLLDTEHWEISLDSCEDIRKLYDDIVLNEIQDELHPDGEIFRKESAVIISATQQEKHKGVTPEAKIVEYMTKTLDILNTDKYPMLIRVAVAHYLIGYIHPFYDGNGRLSRFISSYMIRTELNVLIALRLAYTIKDNRSDYYKAFDLCNKDKNGGDVTPFILMFLQMINNAAEDIFKSLEDGYEKFNYYGTALNKLDLKPIQKEILWILMQNQLFDVENISIKIMSEYLGHGYQKINTNLKKMIEEGWPINTDKNGRSYKYSIDPEELVKCVDGQS